MQKLVVGLLVLGYPACKENNKFIINEITDDVITITNLTTKDKAFFNKKEHEKEPVIEVMDCLYNELIYIQFKLFDLEEGREQETDFYNQYPDRCKDLLENISKVSLAFSDKLEKDIINEIRDLKNKVLFSMIDWLEKENIMAESLVVNSREIILIPERTFSEREWVILRDNIPMKHSPYISKIKVDIKGNSLTILFIKA